ncbi:MAG: 30S ribosomal protein S2 [Candidatus Magasanikbacteria bacterium RIFOXYC2_FULL_39_8]|nr:MAG: 30S ribosomal protein S2 [Candidatus Magasanikbacteria bacterium RIFOXYC2_FULL_39_8]
MKLPSILDMLQAGVHFGHKVSRWHPKMKPFIFTQRNQVHILDLDQTKRQLEEVLPQISKMAAEGKKILFVSTKPQAREIVKQAALDCGMPYLTDRWVGGMLTNFTEIKKLIRKYVDYKEKQATGGLDKYTKKEQLDIAKQVQKMDVYLGGLVSLQHLPDALFVPSVQHEKTAVTEANRMHIPIVGVCDANANPNKVEYVIPANDDAVKSIEMIVGLVRDAVKEGVAQIPQEVVQKPVAKASTATNTKIEEKK